MRKLRGIKNRLAVPVLGLVLAISTIFAPLSVTPVYADPDVPAETAPAETTEETETSTPDEQENTETPATPETSSSGSGDATCYSQVGALGWLICPATGFLAKGIDFLYGLIEQLLIVRPIDMAHDSPVYTIWAYLRSITNIIFVIFLIIIIYSQITGLGINNYGIKKALPKLIISAILVNLSYIICALAVDVSNVIGASLHDLLINVGEEAVASSSVSASINISFYDLFTAIAGTGVIAGLTIAFTGGAMQLLLGLIPVIIGGIISVLVGLFTISLRQALIIILVVVAPLAFVAYLLPNTEKWAKKWLNSFVQMLVFYPMFSMLVGVSRLAGWIFIAGANSPLGVILGVAIQILPLFLAASLMKMSGSVLGAVSGALGGLSAKASNAVRSSYIDPLRAAKKAESIARAAQRNKFNPFSSGSWAAHRNARNYRWADYQKLNEETARMMNEEKLNALKRGNRIIGYNKEGEAIYTQRPLSANHAGNIRDRDMRKAIDTQALHNAVKLRSEAAATRTDTVQSSLNDFLRDHDISSGVALNISSGNAGHFIEGAQAKYEKMNADLSDQAYLIDRIKHATARDTKDGHVLNPAEYEDFVTKNLGPSNYGINKTTAAGRDRALDSKYNYLGFMFQDVDAFHNGNVKRMESYVDNQVTKELERTYKESLQRNFIDGAIACNNILGMRGDYDKVFDNMSDYYNEGHVMLGTSDSNRLAMNFLGMRGAAPTLGRFGKFLNMETWAYTDGSRGDAQLVTMDQFTSGYVRLPERDARTGELIYDIIEKEDPYTGEVVSLKQLRLSDNFLKKKDGSGLYRTKIDLASSLKGTDFRSIDRTAIPALEAQIDTLTPDSVPGGIDEVNKIRRDIDNNMAANLIAAMPGMASGGEQIYSIVGYLTGLKPDNRSGYKDLLDDSDKKPEDRMPDWLREAKAQDFEYRTKNLLTRLTPADLTMFKSDAFAGIVEFFSRRAKKLVEKDHETLELKEDYDDFIMDEEGAYVRDENGELQSIHYSRGKLEFLPEDSEENKKHNANLRRIWAYEQMRDIVSYSAQKLAESNRSVEAMKNPIRRAFKIDDMREQYRKNRGYNPLDEEGDGYDDGILDDPYSWEDSYLEALSHGYRGSEDDFWHDIRQARPDLNVGGIGNDWLTQAYNADRRHGYRGTKEAWAREQSDRLINGRDGDN